VVLAGTNPDDIPDDPEGFAVLTEVRAALHELEQRDRVHLVLTSTKDPERAALLINALQRKADVVLQKSIEEGFGLTVTEAMAKGKPVVAADVGGLRAQVAGGTGLLVDPTDPAAVGKALLALLDDPERRRELGINAAAHVARRYTLDRLVADYRTLTDWREPDGVNGPGHGRIG
jgi:trehalose synthase